MRKIHVDQNAAARIITNKLYITKTMKMDRITPLLKTLHWLPLQSRH